MAPSSSPSTIFDLPKEDLSSILQTLKPSIDATTANSMSVCELRTRITEWLMLNDLSTMHNFKHLENSHQWKVPDKADHCVSCGKYQVASIGKTTANSMSTITEQPLTSRESLVFVGRSTSLPSSVLQIIDFANPSVNPTIILQTLDDRNGNKLVDKKKHGYDYGKDLCIECAQWALPNFKCFSNRQDDWNGVAVVPTASAATANNSFMCFSCRS